MANETVYVRKENEKIAKKLLKERKFSELVNDMLRGLFKK
jgi:hypothetical protein